MLVEIPASFRWFSGSNFFSGFDRRLGSILGTRVDDLDVFSDAGLIAFDRAKQVNATKGSVAENHFIFALIELSDSERNGMRRRWVQIVLIMWML